MMLKVMKLIKYIEQETVLCILMFNRLFKENRDSQKTLFLLLLTVDVYNN